MSVKIRPPCPVLPPHIAALRPELIQNLDELKSIEDERIRLLWGKWYEVNNLPEGRFTAALDVLKGFWHPTDVLDLDRTLAEFRTLDPFAERVTTANVLGWDQWRIMRIFCSSHPYERSPGRIEQFLVRDRHTGLLLGIISLASDLPTLPGRDTHIGWTHADRFTHKRIRHTAIASTIVPVQPFGHNFLGGKCLIALLFSDPTLRYTWEAVYGDVLVGITTTGLFGEREQTQYTGTPFEPFGKTVGSILLFPDDHLWRPLHQWLRTLPEYEAIRRAYRPGIGPDTGIKQKEFHLGLRQLGLHPADYRHGHPRGVFFGGLFDNAREFLCGKIDAAELVPRTFGMPPLVEWRQAAEQRYRTLYRRTQQGRHDKPRLQFDTVFYHGLIGMTWPEALARYGDR